VSAEIAGQLIRAGMSATEAQRKQILFESTERALPAGNSSEILHWFVPGRIEVLGKHTDYAGGRSILCAAERGMCVIARGRSDAAINIFDATDGRSLTFDFSADIDIPATGWAIYPMSVARRVARNFGTGARSAKLRGADIALASDLPRSAGMSSSSALVIAVFVALSEINHLEHRPEYQSNIRNTEELAEYLGCIENGQSYGSLFGDQGVGTFGGSEDHTAILCCRPGTLSQYSFCPVTAERIIKFPADCTFAIAASGVEASKTDTTLEKYNHVSRAAQTILETLVAESGENFQTLRDAARSSLNARERIFVALARSANSEFAPEALLNRFNQFLLESEKIIPAAGDRLELGELRAFGDLVDESQNAAEKCLGNQIAETIALARSARELGAHAASSFGAGFGGSVWAMVPRFEAEQFCESWKEKYRAQFDGPNAERSQFFVTAPGPGLLKL
jgi:galactokinase